MKVIFAHLTDEELCEKVRKGETGAEEALILRYNRLVRACARPLFLAGGDSEDLTQEGLLGLLDAIRQFVPGRDASFATFAQVCVRNRLISAVRSAKRDKHLPLNSSVSWDSVQVDGAAIPQPSPEELVIARDSLARLRQELSPLEREVLGHYLDGLSYDEIAQVTHRSAKSVDNAVQRIRRKLTRP